MAPVQFGRLKPDFDGRTVYLIGGGPSLKGFDFERLRGRTTVAINDAIFAAPHATEAFSIDTVWLRNRRDALQNFNGQLVAAVPDNFDTDLPGLYLKRQRGAYLSTDPRIIRTGDNSGFAALGMAMQRGASRIALLGYDMNGPGHFHGGYAWQSRFGASFYPAWARSFSNLAQTARRMGISIVNCNPRSAITCFPFSNPEKETSP